MYVTFERHSQKAQQYEPESLNDIEAQWLNDTDTERFNDTEATKA